MLLGHIFRLILKRLFSESPPSFLIASLKYKLQKLEKSFLKCSNSCQVYLNPRVCITILQTGIFICQLVLSLCFACSVTQSCLTLCNPMNYSQPGPTGHGIFQARILEWAAISSSRDLANTGIEPTSLASPASPALAGGFFTTESTGRQLLKE